MPGTLDPGRLVLAFLAGIALGTVYFGALWYTVRELPRREHRGRWFVLGLLARLALAVAGFVMLARWGGAGTLVPGLLGLLAARAVLLRRVRGRITGSGP